MSASTSTALQARELRQAFDGSFSAAIEGERPNLIDFLRIRIAGAPYALRLSELASLHTHAALAATPSLLPELRGILGFRGTFTPVYDLAALLGYGAQAASKWLVIAQHTSPIALAFETFESHVRVTPERVVTSASEAGLARERVMSSDGRALPLLHLPTIIAGIAGRIKASGPAQER